MKDIKVRHLLGFGLITVSFISDLLTPLGITDWLGYFLAILILSTVLKWQYIVIATTVSTAFIIIGLIYSPPGISLELAILNRIIAISVLLVTTFLLCKGKEAEDSMRKSEERYRSLVENMKDVIFTLSSDGLLISLNPAFEEISGWSRAEWIGKSFEPIVHPDDLSLATEMVQHALHGETSPVFESRILSKSGTYVVGEFRIAPQIKDGKIVGVLGIGRNITERKRIEDALRKSEEKYRTIFENTGTAMVMDEEDTTIVLANTEMEKLLGYSRGEIEGKSWMEFVLKDDLKKIREYHNLRRIDPEAAPRNYEFRLIDKHGNVRDVFATVTIIPGTKKSVASLLDITDRKKAEEMLNLSEEKFSKAFRFSPAWVTLSTLKEGRYIEVNDTFLQQTVYTREEVIGRTSVELGIWTEPEERAHLVEKIRRDGTIRNVEIKRRTKHGKILTMLYSADIIEIAGEEYLLSTSLDITDFKQTEEALKESEIKYRTLFESSLTGILIADIETRKFKYANPAICKMLGYSEQELITLGISDIHPKYALKHVISEFEAQAKGEKSLALDIPCLRKDRTIVYSDINTTVVIIEGRKCNVGFFIDITERKKAEEEAQVLRQQIEFILGATKTGLDIIDSEFNIRYIDPEWQKVYGDPSGKKCYEYFMGRSEVCPGCGILKALETKTITVTEEVLVKEGNRPVQVTTIPFQNEKGEWLVAEVNVDITERKRLEAQLLQSQKMESVGQLAGGVAHDFNNILTAIMGYATVLQMKIPNEDPLGHFTGQILASVERAANLTHSLLAFSRKQIINVKPVNLNEIMTKVEGLLKRIIGEDIELKTVFTDEELVVMADSGQIEQVLMNLATNARDAMPEGGLLHISTEYAVLDEKFIRAHGYGNPGRYAIISVKDTGTGMDEKTKEKVFEPFFTTKEVGKGTGLGLSIAYGIIKQHNGYIDVFSEQGEGTTFEIFLPLTDLKVEEMKAAEYITPIGGTETILFAEDDKEVRKFIKSVLEEFGYSIIAAEDGKDAIEKFAENKEKVQLLILDVIMPKKNGKEVYEEIKKMKSDMKALFMSGYSADVIKGKGLLEEGFHFVLKPISPTELLRKIREVLDNKSRIL